MTTSLKVRHLARYKDIAVLLLKHGRAEGLTFNPDLDALADEATEADARDLVDDLEALGPTFVKLGQLLSTRADLLPPVYLDALSRLQDKVEPVPFEAIEHIVTSEIGVRISKGFQSFDAKPMASASLGQVHRATLRNGLPVAVKVQRPGVRARVMEDMEVVEELAEFLDSHTEAGRAFGFGAMATEFRRSITDELDYRLEAANLRLLGAQLSGYDQLVVPQPIEDYTTSLVLTMDLIDGRNVGSLGPLARQDVDGAILASQLFDAYLDQILVHGFVHADPHPGNVLLTTDGRLALIDLGMVARIAPAIRDALARLLVALSAGNGEEVAATIADLGEKRGGWDEAQFTRRITQLVQRHEATSLGQLEAGRVVAELAGIAGQCGLRPPAELTMLGKALLNLDQVAAKLDPAFEPDQAIRNHVTDILRRNMLRSASPASVFAAAMDAKEFAEKLPGRVNKVMDALAEGQMTLNIQGIDERELMRGIQKLANRVTTGLIVAALIIGAAMLMRVNTDSKLFGYPAVAIVCFLAASFAGVWLILSSVLHDLPQRRTRKAP